MSGKLRPYPAYRDSGLDWLGPVPAHWQVVRNGRLFAERAETGFPGLPILEVSLRTGVRVRDMEGGRKQQMADRAKYKRAAQGDIAYNIMRMWQGAVGVAPCDGLVSPAYIVARPLDGVDARYYAYLFRTAAYMKEVDFASRGIVPDRNRLYWDYFKPMLSLAPPSDEQRHVADYLDGYMAQYQRLVAAKHRTSIALIERKQAILTELLRSGLAGGQATCDLDWLDQRPASWKASRLKPYIANVVDLVRVTDGDEHPITLDRVESWTGRLLPASEEADANFVGKRFAADDVLFGKLRPYLAKVVQAGRDGIAGTEFLVLRPDLTRISPRFLVQLLRSKPLIDYVAASSMGAKMPRVEWDFLSSIKVGLPELAEQERLCDQFDAASREIDHALAQTVRELQLVSEYRDALTAAVTTGRLDVRGVGSAVVAYAEEAVSTPLEEKALEDELEPVD